MNEDAEALSVEFNNTAARIYSALSKQLLSSVQKLNRKTDENVFQASVAKYSKVLKDSLEEEAKRCFATYSGLKHEELEFTISAKVNYYLQVFQSKCNDL